MTGIVSRFKQSFQIVHDTALFTRTDKTNDIFENQLIL